VATKREDLFRLRTNQSAPDRRACIMGCDNVVDGYTVPGFTLWWERARDLSAVIGGMLADPTFIARIDAARIGTAGFSLGGYTMIAIAGGLTSLVHFRELCASPGADGACQSPPEFGDLLAKAKALADSDEAFRAAYAAHIPHTELTIYPGGGGHHVFLADCIEAGRATLPAVHRRAGRRPRRDTHADRGPRRSVLCSPSAIVPQPLARCGVGGEKPTDREIGKRRHSQ